MTCCRIPCIYKLPSSMHLISQEPPTINTHSSNYQIMAILALVAILLSIGTSTNAQLSTSYYSYTCPNLLSTVQSAVQSAISQDARAGATLVRLFYHDCFVNV